MTGPAPGTLFEALAAFQAGLPKIVEGKTGKVEGTTPQGRPYSYPIRWADLADVSEEVLPRLGAVGLAFTARPTTREDGRFGLAYSLVHASGEREDGFYELPSDLSPQKTGALITYARRYCLCAITGVAAGDDAETARQSADDAEGSRQTAGDAWRTASRTRPRADSAPEDQPGSATKEQLTRLHTIMTKLGFTTEDREQKLVIAEVMTGRAPLTGPKTGRSSGNLSFTEARKLIDTLDGMSRDDLIAMMAEREQAGEGDG